MKDTDIASIIYLSLLAVALTGAALDPTVGLACAIGLNLAIALINAAGVRKSARLAQIAIENRLPVVHCIESAGADLPNQSKIFVPGGRSFRDITRRSAAGMSASFL